MSNILITGASGFLGSLLSQRLYEKGNQITVFTRNSESAKEKLPGSYKFCNWDYRKPGQWQDELNSNEIIIHLAGANLFGKRWDKNYKNIIIESRETGTRAVVDAIKPGNTSVKLLIVASAIGYYGDTGDSTVNEDSPPGNDFLAEVCKTWEDASVPADEKNIRRVNMRMGIIMSTREGYLNKLLIPFRLFIGGSIGRRNSYVSWVHIDDVINSYLHIINNSETRGAFNITSPNNLTAGEIANTLGKIMHRPSFFAAPVPLIKLMVGEYGRYITFSQKVLPQKLLKSGFKFSYPELETALKDLLKNKK